MQRSEHEFRIWLDSLGFDVSEVKPLRGDVSPRRYFRLRFSDGEGAVLAAYPGNDREAATERFLATTRLFETAGIPVPRILASAPRRGFLLVEELGPVSLFELINGSFANLRPHVEAAIEIRERLASQPAEHYSEVNPHLDTHRLSEELDDAKDVFLNAREFSGSESDRLALYSALDELLRRLGTEPLVPSHRDFMSRNLMLPAPQRGPVVIDHQDACLAPRFYDLASLLNDSLFVTVEQEEELLGELVGKKVALEGYRRCAVQRALKATATYLKFALRGFDRLLVLVPPTLARAARNLELLPEHRLLTDHACERWRDRRAVNRGIESLLRPAPSPLER